MAGAERSDRQFGSVGWGFYLSSELFHEIRERLKEVDKDELLRRMGYSQLDVGHRSLKSFLESFGLYPWIEKGNFDFKHNSESFLITLVRELGVEEEPVKEFVSWAKNRMREIAKMGDSYIFVDTNSTPSGVSGFIRACLESLRRTKIDKEFIVGQDLDQVLNYVSIRVRNHYIASHGSIRGWGIIERYIYIHHDGSKYVFDTEGRLIGKTEEEISRPAVFGF